MSQTTDPYRTLGLAPGATLAEVKRAYRRLAKLYHPDSAGGATTARFIAIQRAYEALVSGSGPDGPGPGSQGPDQGATPHRRPSGRRPAPGSRPGAPPWQADPERARATREAGAGPRERPRRGDRSAPKARPGSTSYDGAEVEAFEPEWDGATWYGTASGTYWTINPKEYADPRKHGPEYQARGRRIASDREASALDGEPPAGVEEVGRADDPARSTAAAGTPDADPAPGDAPTDPMVAAAPATTSRGASPSMSEPSDVRMPSARPISVLERVVLALVGWPVLGLAVATVIGEVTGCARFSATCPEQAGVVAILVQPVIVAALLLAPRVAEAATLGTIAVAVVALPAAVVSSAIGGARASTWQATAGLGLLLAIPYVAVFVAGMSGRLRVPTIVRRSAPRVG